MTFFLLLRVQVVAGQAPADRLLLPLWYGVGDQTDLADATTVDGAYTIAVCPLIGETREGAAQTVPDVLRWYAPVVGSAKPDGWLAEQLSDQLLGIVPGIPETSRGGAITELFERLKQAQPVGGTPDPWGRYDWSKPSRAVVACDGHGNGCVLFTVGAHVNYEMRENGIRSLGDLGLDDAPEGLSIWEGKTKTSGVGEDIETWLEGEFRGPTPEEDAAIVSGRCPWNEDAWILRPALEARVDITVKTTEGERRTILMAGSEVDRAKPLADFEIEVADRLRALLVGA